jgi:hypothetical protein
VTTSSSKIVTDALASQIVQNTTLHLNLSQDAIVITEDKVRLCLMEHLAKLEARKDWIAPAGILVTLIATFASTTFKNFILEAAVWEALFILLTVFDIGWLFVCVKRARNAPRIEDVVSSMKKAGASHDSNLGAG